MRFAVNKREVVNNCFHILTYRHTIHIYIKLKSIVTKVVKMNAYLSYVFSAPVA